MTASLYIHIPFCAGICDYCDFYSIPVSPKDLRLSAYIDQILEDVKFVLDKFNINYIPTVYIGGGTPSILGASLISRLVCVLKQLWGDKPPIEITIEANPESCDEAFLIACRDSGVNRLSLGVQSFHEASRKAIGRIGEGKLLMERLKMLSKIFPQSFSVDLISGLPLQDEKILLKDIEKVLAYDPAHVSLYSLTLEPDTPLGKRFAKGQVLIQDKDEADNLWIKGRDLLEKSGYRQYEVSNFCINRKESLHNLRYWYMENWIGLGPAASGTIINDEEARGWRFTYTPDIDLWFEKKNRTIEELDNLTLIKESLLMGFRLLKGPDESLFQRRFKKEIEDFIPKTIKKWRNRALFQEDILALTSSGLLLLNSFLIEAFQELDINYIS